MYYNFFRNDVYMKLNRSFDGKKQALFYILNILLYELENIHKRFPDPLYEFFQRYVPDMWERYLGPVDLLQRYYRNRHLKYKVYSIDEIRKRKKGDTLFILGSNRSVNEIDDSVWKRINNYDSLGFNHWMYHSFIPTYFSMEHGFIRRKKIHKHCLEYIQKRAPSYKNTIFLIHTRARRRGMMPRLMPEYFPPNSEVMYFLYPKTVKCTFPAPFKPEDFKKTIYYRGGLNLYLHLARLMGYKKIVLVGCEMDSAIPFYEYYQDAQWMNKTGYEPVNREVRKKEKYEVVHSEKKKHSFVKTILAINKYVFKPEDIELYVFNKKSLLYPEIPLFEF